MRIQDSHFHIEFPRLDNELLFHSSDETVEVWCDMDTDGGGWTVFLNRQRQTPKLDFAQTWTTYADGFGSPTGEYWLGED